MKCILENKKLRCTEGAFFFLQKKTRNLTHNLRLHRTICTYTFQNGGGLISSHSIYSVIFFSIIEMMKEGWRPQRRSLFRGVLSSYPAMLFYLLLLINIHITNTIVRTSSIYVDRSSDRLVEGFRFFFSLSLSLSLDIVE